MVTLFIINIIICVCIGAWVFHCIEKLLKNFWINIDPFDAYGQFCDKGYSYRSVAFYENEKQKELIERDIKKFEKKFKKKVVTYIKEFEIFYKAEDKHQDYYELYFENYISH